MTLPDIVLSTPSLFVLWQLQKNGYQAYLVGGSVRDLMARGMGLAQQKTKLQDFDFDLATNATPEQILAIFPNSFYENDFGTVSLTPEDLLQIMRDGGWLVDDWQEKKSDVIEIASDRLDLQKSTKIHESLTLPQTENRLQPNLNFEITTYRVGEVYDDTSRSPQQMTWGKDIHEDLSRRDFTINALALTLQTEKLTSLLATKNSKKNQTLTADDYQLLDDNHGLDDLRAGLIRAIGDPAARFREDPLRLLRAVRFSVQLNFAIEETTYQALKQESDLLKTISSERIRDEFLKMLASDYPREAVMMLAETGLLQQFLPELLAMQDVAQSGHHLTDVWVHSLDALAACPSPDPIVRLATLLHDVGKPETQKMIAGQYTFYNHQVVGAHQAKRIAQRLKLSKTDIQRIFILVRQHMFYYQPENTDASIRRFMRQVGLENLNDILDVREADRLGSNARKTSWRLEEMKQRMIEQLNQPLQTRDLAIDGNDLMRELNLKPGPILGEILHYLLELVLDDSDLNQPEKLMAQAREFLAQKQS